MTLIVDAEFRAQMEQLRQHAALNPYTMDVMLDRINKQEPPPGNMEEFRVMSQGFAIVFTHEEHPMGMVRHLSMSVPTAGKYPHPTVVTAVSQLLGFTRPIEECKVYMEPIGDNHEAVNIIEPLIDSLQTPETHA